MGFRRGSEKGSEGVPKFRMFSEGVRGASAGASAGVPKGFRGCSEVFRGGSEWVPKGFRGGSE
eukprot:1963038-Alexandrium_andersonii.AAC.1